MIDSHCHFDFSVFDAQREVILQDCAAVGVTGIIIPGIHPQQWRPLLQLVAQLQSSAEAPLCQVWPALGLHPWWLAELTSQAGAAVTEPLFKQQLAAQLRQPSVVAVGECGLDGSLSLSLTEQIPHFEWQVQLATDHRLPLILHGHKAHHEVLRLLSHYRPPAGGVIHAFSGSVELAQQYWRLGFYLGVGGTITYERASKTRGTIRSMPLDSLLLETDAPDMPLSGWQGQPNSPLRLPQVAACLAKLKQVPVAEIRRQTELNTRRLFALDTAAAG